MNAILRWPITTAVLVGGITLFGCGPKYPNCEDDGDCPENEYCVNNLCQQCRDDEDCPSGQKCYEGACRDIGYCKTSDDCAEGQVCRANVCAACLNDAECDPGEACVNGLCVVPECREDEDCAAGFKCVDHRCITEPPEEPAVVAVIKTTGCTPESVYFAFDSALLRNDARQTLRENYQCLEGSDAEVILEGHCDPRGTTEYNMALGEQRARSVKRFLTNMGLSRGRLRVVSKGEEEATGYNEETWAKDRRVDFE